MEEKNIKQENLHDCMCEEKAFNFSRELKISLAKAAFFIAIGLVSIFAVAKPLSSNQFHTETIKYLDEKQALILKVTAAATTISAVASVIGGERTQPIATKILDIVGYLVIILAAILAEKCLVTLTAQAAFYILIPIACVGLALSQFFANKSIKEWSARIALFGVLIFLTIPVSVVISKEIDIKQGLPAKIEAITNRAKNVEAKKEEINKNEREYEEKSSEINNKYEIEKNTLNEEKDSSNSEGGFFGLFNKAKEAVGNTIGGAGRAIGNVASAGKEILSNIGSKIQENVLKLIKSIEEFLNDLTEVLVVMVVTSCVIPILVFIFFLWLTKTIFCLDISMPKFRKFGRAEKE